MSLARQFELLFLLLQRGGLSAAEAAERFEVSVRTIYRDVDTLSGAGIPVYTQKGRGGGIRCMPQFTMERTYFTPEEQRDLMAAVQSLQMIKGGNLVSVLPKLSGLFQTKERPWIAVDFSQWGEQNEGKFEQIKGAILQGKLLEFRYFNSRNEALTRTVEPLQLLFKQKDWYLWAYCLKREGLRLFKVSRMREMRETGETVRTPRSLEELQPENFSSQEVQMQEFVLQFESDAAYRVYDEFEEETIVSLPEGGFQVSCRMLSDNWLLYYLLSFGSSVTVLEPLCFREWLAREGEKIWRKHKI